MSFEVTAPTPKGFPVGSASCKFSQFRIGWRTEPLSHGSLGKSGNTPGIVLLTVKATET